MSVEKMSCVACGEQHRITFNQIAATRKTKMKPLLHAWIDAGCPIPEKIAVIGVPQE